MILIDKAKLVDKAFKKVKEVASDNYHDGYDYALALIETVDKAEEVDAVPIEWIEQYGKENWYDFGTQCNAITEMLKAWREKNGQTD